MSLDLTPWCLQDMDVILKRQISVSFYWLVSSDLMIMSSGECHRTLLMILVLSTLVQAMAWCHQAPSHYLSQYWSRSMSPYGVARPLYVNYFGETYTDGRSAFSTVMAILSHGNQRPILSYIINIMPATAVGDQLIVFTIHYLFNQSIG